MAKGTQIAQAYVRIIPTTEGINDNITKSLSGVEQSFDKSGLASGVAFGTALGGAIEDAVKLTVTAAGNLLKDTISKVADFEQLSGGAEKIFSGMDTSVILNDAKNAYKDLGMSMNEYLEKINDVGASFKATMGDQTGYEMAKRGLQAISDYATGTGKSVDELTQKFTMITRSTSSYQSIADQFSGILPATSQAFLDEAKAAGFLKDSYTSLSQVPIDEYQQAVTQMLEKGVDALNLTGNTAEEASNTISGSFTKLEKAWDNFIASLGSPDIDTEEMTQNLVQALMDVIDNLAPVLEEMSPAIAEALSTAIIEAGPAIGQILLRTMTNVMQKLPSMMFRQGQAMAKALMDGLNASNPIEALENMYVDAIDRMTNHMSNGAFSVKGLANAIGFVIEHFDKLAEVGSRVAQAISDKMSDLANILRNAFDKASSVVKEWANDMLQKGKDAINGFIKGVKDGLKQAIDNLKNAGKNMAEGLINGFTEKFNSLKSKALKTIDDLVKTIKKTLGIQSPSRVLMEVGDFMAQGLEIGWSKEMQHFNAHVDHDINTTFTSAKNGIVSDLNRTPSYAVANSNDKLVNDLVSAFKNITVQNNVVLEGDAGKLFKSVQKENRIFRNSTGRSAFA